MKSRQVINVLHAASLGVMVCGCAEAAGAEHTSGRAWDEVLDVEIHQGPKPHEARDVYVRCDANRFTPEETTFVPVLDSAHHRSDLSFFLQTGSGSDTQARLYVYGSRTECVDGIRQIAYYGSFATPLLAQRFSDSVIFSYIAGDGKPIRLGSSVDGFSSCNPLNTEKCPLSVTMASSRVERTEHDGIVLDVVHQGKLLFKILYPLSAPRYLPVVGDE